MKPVPQELLQVVVPHTKKPWRIPVLKLEVADKEVSAAGKVNAASIVTIVSAAATITTEEVTLAQALVEIKTSKPNVKGIVLPEPSESITTTTTISSKKS
uniref:Uncharacterized protein n=1 Tax=Tanacetum cinerariifolium TaxID=118510 RepID=A0A699J1T5_TANCI|nr:hypothetical protein [Tanacetum cinerariifolium]